jgi:hypothetical protein
VVQDGKKIFIVTVKLPLAPEHDPQHKKIGNCLVSDYCTDVTGEHHSFLDWDVSAERLRTRLSEKFRHITRIEEVRSWPN